MSGTKKLFEINQRASELSVEGKQIEEIVQILADEWSEFSIKTIQTAVDAWWDGKVSRNFNYDTGE